MDCNKFIRFISGPVVIAGLFACGQADREAEIEHRIRELKQQLKEQERIGREIDSLHRLEERLIEQLNQNDPIDSGSYSFDPEN